MDLALIVSKSVADKGFVNNFKLKVCSVVRVQSCSKGNLRFPGG